MSSEEEAFQAGYGIYLGDNVIYHNSLEKLQGEIAQELINAIDMHPPMHSAHEGYAIILEELDELWDEVKKRPSEQSRIRIREEAIQIAAMAMRIVLDVCD